MSLQELAALAGSGNAGAQYELSSLLHQRGQFDESMHWLALAAAQKLLPAQLTLAIMLMDGRHCAPDRQRAIELLEPLTGTQVHANLLLGELHGYAAATAADREIGLRYLAAAARLGDAGALRQLALLAACQQRWDLVLPLLHAAAQRGDAAARVGLASFGSQPSAPTLGWATLAGALPTLASDIPLPAAKTLRDAPLIRQLPAVIHPLVLDYMINLAAPLVQRSQIVDARTGEARVDPMRNSSHVTLGPREHDHVLEALENCISRISGVPTVQGEFVQILRYRPGEEFRPHVDYFNASAGGPHPSLADGGQRAQTVLIYLNDAYTGGGTVFPDLRLNIRATRGDILHFHNLRADGAGDRQSLHAGMPVTTGEKWLLSQWIRSKPYPARRVI